MIVRVTPLAFVMIAVAGAPRSAAPQSTSALQPCQVRGLTGDVQCTTVRVSEDRGKPQGRQIELRVVVARATGPTRLTDPFVLLAGGPGQAGTEMGEFATQAFSLVRATRDIVLIDARGTGASGALRCAMMRQPADLVGSTLYPEASVRICRDSLARHADLARYTTTAIADDLEAVRRSLGYGQLNLYGTSYGTRLALVYLRRHPSSVRTAVLKAVAPPTMVAPMNYAEDAERAFGLLVRDCQADSLCARAYPSLRADLDSVLSRASRGGVMTSVPNGRGGTDTFAVSRDAIAGALLTAMQSAGQRAMLPRLLHEAAVGNAAPLAAAVVQTRRAIDGILAVGMHLSVSCTDDGGRLDVASARRTDARTFLGPSRVQMLADACREWRVAPDERNGGQPVRSQVPVLLVSGEIDPNTPPRHADDALRTLPNGRHVVLSGVSHGWNNVDQCGAAFVADFVTRASAQELDVTCGRVSRAPRFIVP